MNSRKFYESDSDRMEEQRISAFLSEKYKVQFRKLKPSYKIDWVILKNGSINSIAELKVRHVSRFTYETLMLSLDKWITGKAMASEMNVPFIINIKWSDGLFWHKVGTCPVTYGFGGRTDRDDPQDVEPVVFIPVKEFREYK